MKFSTLTSNQRSAVAALVNSGELRTDKLARCMGLDNPAAATVLCGLRKAGLVYSKERNGNSFSLWGSTLVAETLFSHRPDVSLVYITPAELHLLKQAKAQAQSCAANAVHSNVAPDNDCPSSKKATAYVVLHDSEFPVGTYDDALACAKDAAVRTGKSYVVVALVAEVLPPAAPQPVVNVL